MDAKRLRTPVPASVASAASSPALSYARSHALVRDDTESYQPNGLNAVVEWPGGLVLADAATQSVRFLDRKGIEQQDKELDGFDMPCSLAYSAADDILYVGDRHGVHMVQLTTGDRLRTRDRAVDGMRLDPIDLAYHSGVVYCATGEAVFSLHAATLEPLREFCTASGPGEVQCAWSISADNGYLYVADSELEEVKVYGVVDGAYQATLATGSLSDLSAVRAIGNLVYVADHMRVQVFETIGEACAGEAPIRRLQALRLDKHVHSRKPGGRPPAVYGLWVGALQAYLLSADEVHILHLEAGSSPQAQPPAPPAPL